jgi:hypothetical protein
VATPAGKAGQSRPWTERSEGSGSAPPAESVHPKRKSHTLLINYFYFKRKNILRLVVQTKALVSTTIFYIVEVKNRSLQS